MLFVFVRKMEWNSNVDFDWCCLVTRQMSDIPTFLATGRSGGRGKPDTHSPHSTTIFFSHFPAVEKRLLALFWRKTDHRKTERGPGSKTLKVFRERKNVIMLFKSANMISRQVKRKR